MKAFVDPAADVVAAAGENERSCTWPLHWRRSSALPLFFKLPMLPLLLLLVAADWESAR